MRFLGFGSGGGASVIEGRDGQLFLGNDTNHVMRQITGRMRAGRRALGRLAAVHAERERLCAAQGAAYRHVVCPNKESIAVDDLPPAYAYERYGPTYVAQYLASRPAVRPFYDRACLMSLAGAYSRTDLHWTEYGAVAYLDAVLSHWDDARAKDRIRALEARPTDIMNQGDLGLKIGLGPERAIGFEIPHENAALLFEGNVIYGGHVRWQSSSAPANAGTRALILHDSFAISLFRFLPELYAETLFIHAPDFDPAFVRRFAPDVVWFFQAERFLPRVPRNDVDFASLVEASERRKKAPAHGSRLLRERWPA